MNRETAWNIVCEYTGQLSLGHSLYVGVGAYAAGSDPMLDRAIALYPKLETFLQQEIVERADSPTSINQLQMLFFDA